MKQELEQIIAAACTRVFNIDVDIVLTRPDEQFGDYATNVVLTQTGQLGQNPHVLARKLQEELEKYLKDKAKVTVAGTGFLTFMLIETELVRALETNPSKPLDGKTLLVEY